MKLKRLFILAALVLCGAHANAQYLGGDPAAEVKATMDALQREINDKNKELEALTAKIDSLKTNWRATCTIVTKQVQNNKRSVNDIYQLIELTDKDEEADLLRDLNAFLTSYRNARGETEGDSQQRRTPAPSAKRRPGGSPSKSGSSQEGEDASQSPVNSNLDPGNSNLDPVGNSDPDEGGAISEPVKGDPAKAGPKGEKSKSSVKANPEKENTTISEKGKSKSKI